MIKDLKANLIYMMYDHRYSLIVFWSVLFGTTTLMVAVALFFKEVEMGFSLGLAVFIFCGITGFLVTKETFPYLIKLGSTRNTYLISVLFFKILVALFMATVAAIMMQLITWVVTIANIENFRFYNMMNGTTLADTAFNQFWFTWLFGFIVLVGGFLIGALFYRYGIIGGFTGVVAILLLLILPVTRSAIFEFFIHSFENFKAEINFIGLIVFGLSLYFPAWLLLRKASTTAGVMR